MTNDRKHERWAALRIGSWDLIRHSFVLLCFLVLASCTPAKQEPPVPVRAVAPAPVVPILLATDPCALRMQDIAAAMTVYLDRVHELPPSLTLLIPSGKRVGLALDFTCPVSRRNYVYSPNPLTAPGDPHQLVLYDAQPDAAGQRWAVMILPAEGIRPLTAEVFRISDGMLQLYLKSAYP